MAKYNIPDRWLNYTPIGKTIEGTRFIAFKVPLEQHISESVQERNIRLDSKILLVKIPNLGLIIDLTNTHKYYNPSQSFEKNGIKHVKIMVPGHAVPDIKYRNLFKEAVEEFLENNQDNDKLIGVHCTHGVNRTGFLICNYMVREMNIEPEEAMERFAIARGHRIERENYKEFIRANSTEIISVSEKSYNKIVDNRPEHYESNWCNLKVPSNNNNYNSQRNRNLRHVDYSKIPLHNSWREHDPPPPGTEILTKGYQSNPKSRRIAHSVQGTLTPVSRDIFTAVDRFPGIDSNQQPNNMFNKNCENWRIKSNEIDRRKSTQSNNIFTTRYDKNYADSRNIYRNNSLINKVTGNHNTNFVDSHENFRKKYNSQNSSNSFSSSNKRLEINSKGLDKRNQCSKYNSNMHKKSSNYQKFDDNNKSERNIIRQNSTQRTSMLDDLY